MLAYLVAVLVTMVAVMVTSRVDVCVAYTVVSVVVMSSVLKTVAYTVVSVMLVMMISVAVSTTVASVVVINSVVEITSSTVLKRVTGITTALEYHEVLVWSTSTVAANVTSAVASVTVIAPVNAVRVMVGFTETICVCVASMYTLQNALASGCKRDS